MKTRPALLAAPVLLVFLAAAAWVAWSPGPVQAQAEARSAADQRAIDELVLANRMLASPLLGVLDAFGHVSMRVPSNPNHYFISRYISAGLVTAADIIENDLDSRPVAGPRSDEYQERFIHGKIYKARPDVMALLHSHTPELVAFGVS